VYVLDKGLHNWQIRNSPDKRENIVRKMRNRKTESTLERGTGKHRSERHLEQGRGTEEKDAEIFIHKKKKMEEEKELEVSDWIKR